MMRLRRSKSLWIPAFAGMTALLVACGTVKLPDPIPAGAESWKIPVVPAEIEGVAPQDVLQAEASDSESSEVKEAEMVITVPPSEKPTHIVVKKKPTTLKQRLLTNTPEHSVTSDNQGVTAAQPKIPFWTLAGRWALLVIACLFILAGAGMAIANKVANWSPAGWVQWILSLVVKK